MLSTLYSKALRYLGFTDPHDLNNNFEFVAFAPKTTKVSRLYRDPNAYFNYQRTVRHALLKELDGQDAQYIINEFHHPEATLDMILDTLRKGDLPDHPVPHDVHYTSARFIAKEAFRPPRPIRPVHFADLRLYKWNWHPNVEEPFFSDRELEKAVIYAHSMGFLPDARMSFGNLRNVVFLRTRLFLHAIKRGEITKPAKLWPMMKIHVKPALTTKDKTKVRVIYGVSKQHVLAQAMFYWPLFRYYIESDADPLLWGFETLLGGLQKMHNIMSIPRLYFRTFITIDWGAFDLRSLFSIQREVYDDQRTYFDFNNGYIPTKFYRQSTANPLHLERLWNWQRDATFEMPFVMPDHTVYRRKYRCIPSGLFTTQILDSHVNYIMIMTILSAMGFDITNLKLYVQGDDSVVLLIFFIPPDQHAEFKSRFEVLAKHYFDHEARADKTEIHNDPNGVEILGYTNINGYPTRDWRKLLAQLYHPRGAPNQSVLKARCAGFAYASMYNRNAIKVLRNIWDYLDSKGIIAADLRQMRDIILFGESNFEVPTDHFPSEEEVTRYLRVPHVRQESDRNAYWPSDHFLDTA